MEFSATGGCNCGSVRYKLTAEPFMTVACHCENCRRQSGTAFSVNLVLRADAVEIEGELLSYEDKATESGSPIIRGFCGSCGSPVKSWSSSGPQVVVIKAGTLDDPSPHAPTMHIWTSSKLAWVPIPEGMVQFEKNLPA